jgi:hypothetical protein
VTTANTANAILVIGRGELYFDRFPAGSLTGEGELYLGNTPGFSLERTIEKTKRSRSMGGQVVEIGGIVTEDKHEGTIDTDNVSAQNLALWMGSEAITTGQGSAAGVSETFTVKRGRWRQLGASVHPAGVINVLATPTFMKGATPVTVSGNITLDLENGRFLFNEDAAALNDGDTVTVTFSYGAAADVKINSAAKEIVGALRYVSTNPVGPRISYYFPYVTLSPRQEIDWKADDFVSMSFEMEARKRDALTETVYIRQHPV